MARLAYSVIRLSTVRLPTPPIPNDRDRILINPAMKLRFILLRGLSTNLERQGLTR